MTADKPPPVLAVKGLLRRYATLVALGALDLEIRAGEFFSLLGPSRSGKTSCLDCHGPAHPKPEQKASR